MYSIDAYEWGCKPKEAEMDEKIEKIKNEYRRMIKIHPSYNSAHEGLAVIWEEFEELKVEVWKKKQDRTTAKMLVEASHIAATALRFMIDLCNDKSKEYPYPYPDSVYQIEKEEGKVEEYIRSLIWSSDATELDKLLVAGNIRTFWKWLGKKQYAQKNPNSDNFKMRRRERRDEL